MGELRAEEPIRDDGVEIGELAGSLGFLLRLAQLQIFEEFFTSLGKYGLRPGEYSILWLVSLNPGQRQGAIARRLRIKPAHMTKVIQRLETAGYLLRTIPDDDRRSVVLSLTPKGYDFVERHRREYFGYFDRAQPRLTVAERETLISLLRKYVRLDGDSEDGSNF